MEAYVLRSFAQCFEPLQLKLEFYVKTSYLNVKAQALLQVTFLHLPLKRRGINKRQLPDRALSLRFEAGNM